MTPMLLLTAVSITAATPDTLQTGADLVRAMHARYAESWYTTVTFEQATTFYHTDGRVRNSQVWAKYLSLPGRMRIEVGARETGNGILVRADSVYQFEAGELAGSEERVFLLMALGFDVYHRDPDDTIARLAALGFDLERLRTGRWRERDVYVVGADIGDEHSAQFWVDVERLTLVRHLEPVGPEGESTGELLLEGYETLGGGWIAREVQYLTDGRLVQLDRRSLFEADVNLSESTFDPASW